MRDFGKSLVKIDPLKAFSDENLKIVGIREELEMSQEKLIIHVGKHSLAAKLEENSSVTALKELLQEKPLTIRMRDYARMEKVGDIGRSLPTNDRPTHAKPCDLILYLGNSFVIYYESNSWNFTRLGKIENVTPKELRTILGQGDVSVTLELSDPE